MLKAAQTWRGVRSSNAKAILIMGGLSFFFLVHKFWSGGLPVAGPFSNAIFEDLQDRGTNIVLSVQPWKWLIRVKWGFPLETTIGLELHTE